MTYLSRQSPGGARSTFHGLGRRWGPGSARLSGRGTSWCFGRRHMTSCRHRLLYHLKKKQIQSMIMTDILLIYVISHQWSTRQCISMIRSPLCAYAEFVEGNYLLLMVWTWFLSTPVLMHGWSIYIAFCLSVHPSVIWPSDHISEMIELTCSSLTSQHTITKFP